MKKLLAFYLLILVSYNDAYIYTIVKLGWINFLFGTDNVFFFDHKIYNIFSRVIH